MPNIEPGIYKHYKGNLYQAIDTACHSETLEKVVVYRALYDIPEFGSNSLWVRPQKMFLETVKVNNKRVPRFAKINPLPIRFRDIFWITIFPFVVFMINYTLFVAAREWSKKVYVDDYLHFFGGASIAFSSLYIIKLLEQTGYLIIKNILLKLFIVSASVALVAVLWECYEFICDILSTPINQPNVADTIKDLVLGLLGSVIFTNLYFFIKNKKSTFLK